MRVERADAEDTANWLLLGAEVEELFGPLVDNPGFHRALQRNIERGSAYCVREGGGGPGTRLCGGMLVSVHPPQYTIRWLAIAQRWQRQGIGRLLVEHVLRRVPVPAAVSVVTFGEDIVAGQPARAFYQRLGFRPAESAPIGPEGGSRQVFRRVLDTVCTI